MPSAKRSNAAASLAPSGLFAGTSGWAYPTWKPGFYPAEVSSKRFLEYYGTRFNSVEVQYTYTSELKAGQLEGWLAAVPAGFRFTFKAPQSITHFKRLLNTSEALDRFLASLAPAREAGKLGALLFQLPHNFKPDLPRLDAFLRDSALREYQVAFEFLHAGWFADEVYALLRRQGVALCVSESEKLQAPDEATADFRYYRHRYSGAYKAATLRAIADTLAKSSEDRYVYFRHEDEPFGPKNALTMLRHANKVAKA